MRRRSLILAVAASATCLAPLAQAGEAKDKGPKAVGLYVDIQPVAMPIIVQGVLVNYVFVSVRVNLQPGSDVIKLRTKEPFFRDALVREAHRTPFVLPNDWQSVDEAKLAAALMRDAQAITGPGVVASIKVTNQAPQKRVAPPRPAAAN